MPALLALLLDVEAVDTVGAGDAHVGSGDPGDSTELPVAAIVGAMPGNP